MAGKRDASVRKQSVQKQSIQKQAEATKAKLREILADLEKGEGLANLTCGSLQFEIKPDTGVLWYVAYGTATR